MSKRSAGILAFRRKPELEFFLVHPGGPFAANKDEGIWSIPKGEYTDEEPFDAARREFTEETGFELDGEFHPLEPVTLKSGKHVTAWAVEADFDATKIVSNTFTVEWPPKSGKRSTFPEVDRADWFDLETAKRKVNPAQQALLDELAALLNPRR